MRARPRTRRSTGGRRSKAASSSAGPAARCGSRTSRSAEIGAATERATGAGASIMFGPREGPAGWRSVVSVPDGAEVALWQRKR